jgi:hypothetical protein
MGDAGRAAAGAGSFLNVFMGPEAAADKNTAIKALAQEFGTSFHAPNPYMRPAFDAQANATIKRVADYAWIEVLDAVARRAKKG